METMFQYRIPVWHPILVHFPVVLVLTACVAVLVWLVLNRRSVLLVATMLHLAGFVGGLAAYFSGDDMYEQSEGVQIVEELVGLHESLALASLWVVGLGAAFMLFALRMMDRDMSRPGSALWIRVLVAVISLMAAILIWMTGHVGGTMAWGVPV